MRFSSWYQRLRAVLHTDYLHSQPLNGNLGSLELSSTAFSPCATNQKSEEEGYTLITARDVSSQCMGKERIQHCVLRAGHQEPRKGFGLG